jgi:WNK lysine deficient protein kinase
MLIHQDSGAPIAVGKLRGEDYNFEFHGKVHDGKMHFRLVMTEAGGTEPQPPPPAPGEPPPPPPFMRTIDFTFDPDIDTADNLAAEISENFNLSPTDTEICAAALREWLAKEMPGSESQK